MAGRIASRHLPSILRYKPISPPIFGPYSRLPRNLQPIAQRFAHAIPRPTTSARNASETQRRKLIEPHYKLTFTCVPCGKRSAHEVSKQGYHKGSVLITCPSCRNRHVISDNLNIFGDRKITVEDLLREKGQLVKRGTLGENGDIEFWEDTTVDSTETGEAGTAAAEGSEDGLNAPRETVGSPSNIIHPTHSASVLSGCTGARVSAPSTAQANTTPSGRRQFHVKQFQPPAGLQGKASSFNPRKLTVSRPPPRRSSPILPGPRFPSPAPFSFGDPSPSPFTRTDPPHGRLTSRSFAPDSLASLRAAMQGELQDEGESSDLQLMSNSQKQLDSPAVNPSHPMDSLEDTSETSPTSEPPARYPVVRPVITRPEKRIVRFIRYDTPERPPPTEDQDNKPDSVEQPDQNSFDKFETEKTETAGPNLIRIVRGEQRFNSIRLVAGESQNNIRMSVQVVPGVALPKRPPGGVWVPVRPRKSGVKRPSFLPIVKP